MPPHQPHRQAPTCRQQRQIPCARSDSPRFTAASTLLSRPPRFLRLGTRCLELYSHILRVLTLLISSFSLSPSARFILVIHRTCLRLRASTLSREHTFAVPLHYHKHAESYSTSSTSLAPTIASRSSSDDSTYSKVASCASFRCHRLDLVRNRSFQLFAKHDRRRWASAKELAHSCQIRAARSWLHPLHTP